MRWHCLKETMWCYSLPVDCGMRCIETAKYCSHSQSVYHSVRCGCWKKILQCHTLSIGHKAGCVGAARRQCSVTHNLVVINVLRKDSVLSLTPCCWDMIRLVRKGWCSATHILLAMEIKQERNSAVSLTPWISYYEDDWKTKNAVFLTVFCLLRCFETAWKYWNVTHKLFVYKMFWDIILVKDNTMSLTSCHYMRSEELPSTVQCGVTYSLLIMGWDALILPGKT